jgi:hypothetical protein
MDFITLGIGPGGDVPAFILVGLAPNDSVVVQAATADLAVRVRARRSTVRVAARVDTVRVRPRAQEIVT